MDATYNAVRNLIELIVNCNKNNNYEALRTIVHISIRSSLETYVYALSQLLF